jgi:hypothetical protein
MKKYLVLSLALSMVIMALTVFISCGKPSYEAALNISDKSVQTLSLVNLPSAGPVSIEPVNAIELDRLGLGGPSPFSSPPYAPYAKNGLYYSEPFALLEGDNLQITIHSDSPVSWFGVDWSPFALRGVLATTELDEDGRAFNPQYPIRAVLDEVPNGYKLTVSYKIMNDTDCVLLVKNNSPDNPQQLSVAVALKPSISLRRIIKSIPGLRNLIDSEDGEIED